MTGTDLALGFHSFLGIFSAHGVNPNLWVPLVKTNVALQVAHNVQALCKRDKQPWFPHCPPIIGEAMRSQPIPGAGVHLEALRRSWTKMLQSRASVGPEGCDDSKEVALACIFQAESQFKNLLLSSVSAEEWDEAAELSGFVRCPPGYPLYSFRVTNPWVPKEGKPAIDFKEDNALLGRHGDQKAKAFPGGENTKEADLEEEAEEEGDKPVEDEYGQTAKKLFKAKKGEKVSKEVVQARKAE